LQIEQQGLKIVQQGRELASRIDQLRNDPKSSPTPSTVGNKAFESLQASQSWIELEGSGERILSSKVDANTLQNESELIRLLTPRLRDLVAKAAEILGIPLVLVNTERHAYFKDPHGGADPKPDMLVTHPAFYTWNLSNTDKHYQGENFIFGEGADWCLRDCWEVIMEWKKEIGPNSFSALGEGIEYASRKSFVSSKGVAADWKATRFTRLMICDAHRFHLVLCDEARAMRCVWGEWVAPGSEQAVVDFLVRGFQPDSDGLSRVWIDAIGVLCTEFKVELRLPCKEEHTCFLGAGSGGRVFRVIPQDPGGEPCALKVGLGDVACSQIREEWSKYQLFSAEFGEAREILIAISKHYESPKRTFASILVVPVGTELPRTKKSIKSALEGLMKLSKAGFRHGDARRYNVIWVPAEERCKWLDLRTMNRCAEDKVVAFLEDTRTFLMSCGLDYPHEFEEIAQSSFSGDNVDALVQLFQFFWQ